MYVAEKVLNNAVKVRRTVPPFGVERLDSLAVKVFLKLVLKNIENVPV